jgi:hypothetical protein
VRPDARVRQCALHELAQSRLGLFAREIDTKPHSSSVDEQWFEDEQDRQFCAAALRDR